MTTMRLRQTDRLGSTTRLARADYVASLAATQPTGAPTFEQDEQAGVFQLVDGRPVRVDRAAPGASVAESMAAWATVEAELAAAREAVSAANRRRLAAQLAGLPALD